MTREGAYWRAARTLHQQKLDVWIPNLRDIGKGSLHSAFKDPKQGPLRHGTFTHSVLQDFTAIVDHVYRKTGQRVHVIGQSHGAHVAMAGVSGIDEAPQTGRLMLSQKKADWVLKHTASYVGIVPPVDFSELSQGLRLIAQTAQTINPHVSFSLPNFGLSDSIVDYPYDAPPSKTNQLLRRNLRRLGKLIIPVGALDLESFDENEFYEIFRFGLNSIPVGLQRSYAQFGSLGHAQDYYDPEFSFSKNRKPLVPTLLIAGARDTIVRPHTVEQEARRLQQSRYDVEVDVVDAAHGDTALGQQAADEVFSRIARFILDKELRLDCRTILN